MAITLGLSPLAQITINQVTTPPVTMVTWQMHHPIGPELRLTRANQNQERHISDQLLSSYLELVRVMGQ